MFTTPRLIIGSDPEVFLKDSSGNTVSAIGIIPGSKERPFITQHGSIQPDNISAEFNSVPSTTRSDFINNHKLIMSDLLSVVEPLGLSLDIRASVMAKAPLLKPIAARKAGCEPDYNAWDYTMNIPPQFKSGLRAAGGHLHISFDQADTEEATTVRQDFIKCCDLMLGIPSVLLDTDTKRRSLYGKAGSHRPKYIVRDDPYNGVEYRTLSNFWLLSDDLMGWAFDSVRTVHENLDELLTICNSESESIINIINTCNKSAAKYFMKRYGELYEAVL